MVRPNTAHAVQPFRFSSVQAESESKSQNALASEEEDDKLYKRLEIEVRGHDPAVIKSYIKFATTAAEHLNIEVGKKYELALKLNFI